MKRPGFTLIEMLLAFTLSAYIIWGLTRLYQTVVRQVAFTRSMGNTQRAVFLLLHQMRADLSAAFVPESLPRDDKEDSKADASATEQEKPVAGAAKEKEAAALKEQYKNMFLLTAEENDDVVKVEGTRRHLVKQLSFVTTNPLHVYGQKRQRLVRVVYELVRDKKNSTRARDVYDLVRKELLDIMNYSGKDAEQSFVVAQNIKGFFVECSMFKKDIPVQESDKKEASGAEEKEIDPKERVTVTTWGDKAKLQGFVPQAVTCWIEFWGDEGSLPLLFSQAVAIASYPSRRGSLQKPPPEPAASPLAPDAPAAEKQPESTAGVPVNGNPPVLPPQPAPGASI
jgi:hypothetical protein